MTYECEDCGKVIEEEVVEEGNGCPECGSYNIQDYWNR